MTDRRVRILRFYLLLAALVVATAVCCPKLALLWFFTPFGIIPCPDCCGGGCTTCNDAFEGDMQAVIGGFVDGSGFPGSTHLCATAFNATHVLTNPVTTDCPNAGAKCSWGKTGSLDSVRVLCVSHAYLILATHELVGSNYKSFVKIFYCESRCSGGDTGAAVFEFDHGTSKVDCADFSAISLTRTATGRNCGAGGACPGDPSDVYPCDATSATCTLSAL